MKVKRALVSVSDKTGLEGIIKALDGFGVEILSTGGTARKISSMGIPVTEVAAYTGYPEMMDGRVKTLHPKVHAGLLAVREDADHMRQAKENNILMIDMVVVNLYPFEETISKEGVTLEEAIENIDIGGPAMLRSASKNYKHVAVVSSTDQYDSVIEELKASGGKISEETSKKLATAVFAQTAHYDGLITKYLSGESCTGQEEDLPDELDIKLKKSTGLRYGENPHQKAAFYENVSCPELSIGQANQHQGKELSFNNLVDLSSAIDIIKYFDGPAVAVVKHNNPCGAATADTLEKAYVDALDSDRLSAFGSIMSFNGIIDKKLAETILEEADFVECIVAPGYGKGALDVFAVKKNLRILDMPEEAFKITSGLDVKMLKGGALIQEADVKKITEKDLKVVTDKKPSKELMEALLFGWNVVKSVKSNAIVLANGTKTVGIGAGQMSRVDSVMIAVRKAGERARGSILASDAFFPKADSIEEAHKAGVTAIIQPGGSIRDDEVIKACNEFGIPMVLTGVRHFKH